MALTAGTRLGPYEILAPIGAGGMGEVYRASDTKLDREVAIKVLPAALAQDPERLARFEREAKVLASLNHPNIAQIYGVEDRRSRAGDGVGAGRDAQRTAPAGDRARTTPSKSPTRSKPRTKKASSIAI